MNNKYLTAFILTTLLAGCENVSFYSGSNQNTSNKRDNIETSSKVINEASLESTGSNNHFAQNEKNATNVLQVTDRAWLGNKTLVKAPTDPLPAYLLSPKAVSVNITEPQVLPVVLGRVEAALKQGQLPTQLYNNGKNSTSNTRTHNITFEIEERAPRSNGERVKLQKSPTLKINWSGPLNGLLDGISGETGYRWHFSSLKNIVTFYRYHDQEFADNQPKPQTKWNIDPTKHKTLRQALNDWATESGWSLTWSDDIPDYGIGAPAFFYGTFQEAVTSLADENQSVAPFVPWFYHENKQLVIRSAKEI